jgi:PEP-CTERM motif
MKTIITSNWRPLRRAFCTILLLGIAELWAMPGSARAAAIDYTLTDVSAYFPPYGLDIIRGEFRFDPVTTEILSANITVTGAVLSNNYTFPYAATANAITVLGPDSVIGPPSISIDFVDQLMSTSDRVSEVDLSLFPAFHGSVSVTGSAIPASVPEPSTWSMIAIGGVALLGIMLRKKHRTA